jgi:thiamine-phosphate pyrophosphorylase
VSAPFAAGPEKAVKGLYGILDPSVVLDGCGNPEDAIDAALAEGLSGGCRLIQYRDKAAHPALLLSRAGRLARACRSASALFLVNDRLDVAVLSGADGCHLGQDDLPVGAARRIAPPGFLLGVSTHSVPEARRAQEEGADYIGVGAIFPTASKGDALPPRGPRLVAEVAASVTVPVVAIAGITRKNVREVIRAGAAAFAVISDLFAGPGIRRRAEEFIAIWESERSRP